jgi:hypothetical protein
MQAPIRKKPSIYSITKHKDSSDNFATSFCSTKRDKRRMKHSLLVSKAKSSSVADPQRISKTRRRTRHKNKLATNLNSILIAIEDIDGAKQSHARAQAGLASSSSNSKEAEALKLRTMSLRSGPGVRKRKLQLEALERKRFKLNLAMMATAPVQSSISRDPSLQQTEETSAETETQNLQNKWAALKSHIQAHINVKPEFTKKEE